MAISLCLFVPNASAQQTAEKDFGAFKVTLRGRGPSTFDPGAPIPAANVHVRIDWKNGRPIDVELEDFAFVVKPEQIAVLGTSRILIHDDQGREVAIVDSKSGDIVDRVHGIGPTISSDGRYIFLVRWIPNGDQINESVYLIYDVTQSPAANRMPHAVSERMSGIAVYPPENVRAKAYYLAKAESEAHSFYSGGFVWISNQQVVFADKWHDAIKIVLVDVRDGVEAAKVYVAPVQRQPGRPDWQSFVHTVEPISVAPDAIRVRLSFNGPTPPTEVTIPISNR